MLLQNRYELKEEKGSGTFGVTYLATDHGMPSKPDRIIKKLNYKGTAKAWEQAKRLFEEEAKALETLGNHPQIPTLYEYFTQTNAFYLALEYIPGTTLHQDLRQGYKETGRWLDETQVRQLLREILEVLSVVHQAAIIHRDLKPENIMRRATDNRLVLIDFGAVKRITSDFLLDPDTVIVGTPGYIPSEQSMDKPKLGSDVYAVGMIALEALTGQNPVCFGLDDDNQVIWSDYLRLSPEFSHFLNTALAPTIRQRYASAGHALAELQRLEGVEPTGFVYPSSDPPFPTPVYPRGAVDDSQPGGTVYVPPLPPPEPAWWEEALTWLGSNGLSLVEETGRVGWELVAAVLGGIFKGIEWVLVGSLKTLANAQSQGIPIFWLVGLGGSYALVGLSQAGGEVLLLQSGKSDVQEIIWFTRIFWVLVLTGGATTGCCYRKRRFDRCFCGCGCGWGLGLGCGLGLGWGLGWGLFRDATLDLHIKLSLGDRSAQK